MKTWKLALTVLTDLLCLPFSRLWRLSRLRKAISCFRARKWSQYFGSNFSFYIRDITVSLSQWHNAPLLSTMMEPYAYSLIILWGALAVSFLIAVTPTSAFCFRVRCKKW
ncbi:hypothetical protein [Geobacillus thermodenitrificans]|uniref:hypothetical protein n=1 Tax=Geobacillus thermodenitrificans TaxID=33940 RepID=UPI001EE3B5EA|nr:hypothetical protein [Geobacillus thermodenitrificans]